MIYYQNLLHFWFKKVIFISRSYKRTPRCGDKKDKYLKNYANRRLRQYPINKPPLNNCTYKKYNCQWDICDYDSVGISFERYWRRLKCRFHDRPDLLGTKEEAYKEYIKWFIRK